MVQTCILSDDFIEQYNKLPSNLSEEERREAIIRLLTAFFTSSMLTIHSFRSDVKNLNSITQKEVKFGRYLDNGFSRPGDLPQYFNLDNNVSYSLTKAGHEGSTISKNEYSVTRNNVTTYYTKEDFLNKINAGEFDLDDVIVKANTKDPNIQQALRDYEVRNKDRFDVNTKESGNFGERSLDDPEFFKAVKDGDLIKLDEMKGVSKLIKKPTYKIGQSDGGPGLWGKRTISGKQSDIDFQRKVTGAPENTEYIVKGPNKAGEVKFDGFDPEKNVLLDAKRFENFPKIYNGKMIGEKNILDEARRQLSAEIKDFKIEWHIAGKEQADILRKLFRDNGVKIKIVYPPTFL